MRNTLYKTLQSDLERHSYYEGKTQKNSFLGFLHSLFLNIRFLPVFIYRLASYFQGKNFRFIARALSFVNFLIFGAEISSRCSIGPGLCFPHTLGSVIGASRIGKNALIYHGVTVGANAMDLGYTMDERPLIGDNVTLGSGAKILGGITIGNNVIVGANAVVVKSIPDNVVVGGVPAKVIREIEKEKNSCEDKGSSSEIYILMGAYNGSKYIEKQIASIQMQDHGNWRLIIRDDGSADDTLQIIESIASTDDRVSILSDDKGNLGAAANFALLLEYARSNAAQYVALADQDDFWEKWKLKKQLDVMLEEERENQEEPILVYSDLMVVDENLRFISSSMMSYQLMRHEPVNPLDVLLVQNYVTGCTVLINRKLLDISVPLPEFALMHDWWLALLAGACGSLCYIDEPLVYYRQHADNEVGAKSFLWLINPKKTSWTKMWRLWGEGNRRFPQSILQARDLYERIDEKKSSVSLDTKLLIRKYLDIWDRKSLAVVRVHDILRLGIRRQNFCTQIIFCIRCLLVRSLP